MIGCRQDNNLDIANNDMDFPTDITHTATPPKQPQHQVTPLDRTTRAQLTDGSSSKPLITYHHCSAVRKPVHTLATDAEATLAVLAFSGGGGLGRLGSWQAASFALDFRARDATPHTTDAPGR